MEDGRQYFMDRLIECPEEAVQGSSIIHHFSCPNDKHLSLEFLIGECKVIEVEINKMGK